MQQRSPPVLSDAGSDTFLDGTAAAKAWHAFERIQLGYFGVDHAHGTISRANDAFARMFGYEDAAAVVGVSIIGHFTDPRERAEAAARIYGHPDLKANGYVRFEARRLNVKTNELVDVLMSLVPVFDATGAVVDVDGFCEHLGQRQRVEKAFADSEERFRILFETGAIGQALLSPEGMLTRVNASLAQLLGRPAEALVGTNLQELLDPAEHTAATEMLTHDLAVTGNAAHSGDEWRFVHPDGTTVWCQVAGSWMVREGHAHSLALFVLDISRKKYLEEQILRMEKLKAVGTLAGGIAHDFNNALAAILGNLSLAGALLKNDPQVAELLAQAELAGKHASELTQQLITFAAGGSPVKVAVDLNQVVYDAVGSCLPALGIAAEVDAVADLLAVEADRGQIGQVVQVLLLHAAEAGPRDGKVRVCLRNCLSPEDFPPELPTGPLVRVDVTDAGPGMSADQLARVFDPYYSTRRNGAGLGMATVQSIIRRHHATIEAYSQPGQGTRISFWLKAAAHQPAAVAERPTGLGLSFDRPVTVLVLDDEPMVLRATQTILTRLGAVVTAATTGEQAVLAHQEAVALGRPFDVVILDLTVHGGMGGIEALEQMLLLQPSVRAVVCSGYSSDPAMSDPESYGFKAVLPKPFSLAQLAAAVRELTQDL